MIEVNLHIVHQTRKEGDLDWRDLAEGEHPSSMRTGYEYRVINKPAAPKWPQTTLPEGLLVSKWYNGGPVRGADEELAAMWRIVNAGIEYECSIGALVPADKVREIEAKVRKEWAMQEAPETEVRDMAIAINVRAACHAKLPGQVTNDELNRIISGTK